MEAELGIDTARLYEILVDGRVWAAEEQEFNLADLSTIAAIITLLNVTVRRIVAETKAIEEMPAETDNARVRSSSSTWRRSGRNW